MYAGPEASGAVAHCGDVPRPLPGPPELPTAPEPDPTEELEPGPVDEIEPVQPTRAATTAAPKRRLATIRHQVGARTAEAVFVSGCIGLTKLSHRTTPFL
jgi:hypothetical protein